MSLAELFAKDPLDLTTDDRSQIIQEMRNSREKWMLGAKTPKAKADKPALNLSLDDLGI